MNKLNIESPVGYKADAMTKSVCLICGEQLGDYEYRGKAVCKECIKLIRSNY
jgi:hypothetical protein